jgi:hypothetical protein
VIVFPRTRPVKVRMFHAPWSRHPCGSRRSSDPKKLQALALLRDPGPPEAHPRSSFGFLSGFRGRGGFPRELLRAKPERGQQVVSEGQSQVVCHDHGFARTPSPRSGSDSADFASGSAVLVSTRARRCGHRGCTLVAGSRGKVQVCRLQPAASPRPRSHPACSGTVTATLLASLHSVR